MSLTKFVESGLRTIKTQIQHIPALHQELLGLIKRASRNSTVKLEV